MGTLKITTVVSPDFVLHSTLDPQFVIRAVNSKLLFILQDEFRATNSVFLNNALPPEDVYQHHLIVATLDKIVVDTGIRLSESMRVEGIEMQARIEWDDPESFTVFVNGPANFLPVSTSIH